MNGIRAIIRKELADHFSSNRFLILFALIAMVSLITVYMVGLNLKTELQSIAKPKFVFLMLFTSSGSLFSLVQFVAFFGPLLGLVLGFDAINRERSEGTLSKLLSQPIYRDAVINGKFFAGVITISVMMTAIVLVVTGLGLKIVGVVPGSEELWRILIYLIISIVYISFWLGVSLLSSILFRSIATSALAAMAAWIFFSFFIPLGASVVANALFSGIEDADAATLVQRSHVIQAITLASPMELYTDAASIIDPTRKSTRSIVAMGPMERLSISRFSGPLSLLQSFTIVIPYVVTLIAITVIFFGISYLVFMRQEIRSL